MDNQIEIKHVTVDDVHWTFDNPNPYFLYESGSYDRAAYLDPFPSYHHDLALVKIYADLVAESFPLSLPVTFYVLNYDTPARTNGTCFNREKWDKKGKYSWAGASIFLYGKRVPPHPCMTRYLVAHEYGHAVQRFCEQRMNVPENSPKLVDEYAKERGVFQQKHYGSGTWHTTPGEVFANDFRILVPMVELEFWPHNCCRPEESKFAREFWNNQLQYIKELKANAAGA